jgi:hypothetical protein
MPTGHSYFSEDGVAHTVSRHHGAEVARLAEHSVNITATGVSSSDDSPTETVERPLIDVGFFDGTFGLGQYVDDLAAAEARELAHFIHARLARPSTGSTRRRRGDERNYRIRPPRRQAGDGAHPAASSRAVQAVERHREHYQQDS